MIKYFYSIFILFFFLPLATQGVSFDIVINEIAWAGTNVSANDEWIELYNNTGNPINLEGWVLKADDGTPEIKLSGIISPGGFFLLERTDDNTVSGISAGQIYTGALENNGEDLKLFDGSGALVDRINCASGWFTGDNSTKQTMERKSGVRPGSDPGNWQTSQNPAGTPKAQNSIVLTETPKSVSETQDTEEKLAKVESLPDKPTEDKLIETGSLLTYPGGIVLNEILPSPKGFDEEEEWIEIFNSNNFEVDISSWEIKDTEGKTTAYVFPEKAKIPPKEFLMLLRPVTKITLNNDGDGLNLIQPNGNIIDTVNYEKALRGQSYNKMPSGWAWSTVLTPGKTNIIPSPQVPPQAPAPKSFGEEPKDNKPKIESPIKLFSEKETAEIAGKIPLQSNFLSVLSMALAIAIPLSIAVLFLKKRIN